MGVLAVAATMSILSAGTVLATSEPLQVFNGTAEGDSLRDMAKADLLKGLGGNDMLEGFGGDDTLYGGPGHDGLYGGPGDEEVHGGSGDDRSDERIVQGDPGADTVYSVGDNAGDVVDCGLGTDTVKRGQDQNLDRFVNCEKFVD